MIWKQFTHLEHFPPELKARFNSFLTTEFDDSLSVEMQLRVLIKWIKENINLTNEMVDYLNEFIETFDKKLYQSVLDILHIWLEDGLLSEIVRIAISEEIMESRTDVEGETFDHLNKRLNKWERKVNGNEYRLNVKYFGVKGDGLTDDYEKMQLAFNYSSSNNVPLYIPEGVYNLNPPNEQLKNSKRAIYLKSNLNIKLNDNAVLYSPNVFYIANAFKKGYDGGQKNIVISGGKIEGDFRIGDVNNDEWLNGRVCGAFHHTKNMLIKNVHFSHCVSDSHMFDLSGCSDIKIIDCVFEGMKPSRAGRTYVEAIQLDNSYTTGLTWHEDNQNAYVDGLPTINVEIIGCKTQPFKNELGAILYEAPSLVGNHLDVGVGTTKNITIKNCYMDGIISHDGIDENPFIRIWSGENIIIDSNTFNNRLKNISWAISLISSSSPLPFNNQSTPKKSKNIFIKNNTFIGFDNVVNSTGVLVLTGNSTKHMENVVIENNHFYGNESVVGADGQDLITLGRVEDVVIKNNVASNVRKFLWLQPHHETKNIKVVGNQVKKVRQIFIASAFSSTNYMIESNVVNNLQDRFIVDYDNVSNDPSFQTVDTYVSIKNNVIFIKEESNPNDNIIKFDSGLNGDRYLTITDNTLINNSGKVVRLISNGVNISFLDISNNTSNSQKRLFSNTLNKFNAKTHYNGNYTLLFTSPASTMTGNITLSKSIQDYSKLILQLGNVSLGTFESIEIVPFNIDGDIVWRNGVDKFQVRDYGYFDVVSDSVININLTKELRAVYGVQ